MPQLGFGVFQAPPEETSLAVETALRAGYRHIDTAAAYFNEREVGEGLRRSGVNRADVFIETKVWISDYEDSRHAFEKASRKLGVDVIDLFILHQPLPTNFDRTIAAYKGLEHLLADGKVRSIGISNFMPEHVQQLLDATDVVPAINQVELHPYFQQPDVQTANAQHGILTQAWSPIGGITFYPGFGEERRSTLQDPVINEIAGAHGKSPAQVMLRWHIQEGRQVIPKSTNAGRIAENIDVLDFSLSDEEIATIDALDTGVRGGPEPAAITLETNGMPIPED
ncbi:aldo/keto reductase [Corynebacterium capitovis]|uniref:aldo/keto reductase n=1 Tax=Corynebacterium capitovis TaxID=131081 RepID=UPI000684E6A4|nr:aldo/keto reductase [Corynebacterium capitovis]